MPVGVFLAVLAMKNGASYVALFSDTDHHSHPASACIDAFNEQTDEPIAFSIENARIIFTNNRGWMKTFLPDFSREPTREEYKKMTEEEKLSLKEAKDWFALLDYLVAYPN